MGAPVFTYGSLMFPEVWTRVVRGTYLEFPATLQGYARFAVHDETYPGVIATDDARAAVAGVTYFDVSPADLQALDAFEGEDYQRTEVTLHLPNATTITAWTYLYLPIEKLSDQPWLPERFELQRFLDGYCKAKLG